MPHDVKKSYRSDALNGTVLMLLNFLCFYITACINSPFSAKLEICLSLVLALTDMYLPLKLHEDLVPLKFLLCWCNILIATHSRRFAVFCKTAQLVLHGSFKSFLQELTVPVMQIIVAGTEIITQWDDLMILLSLLCATTQFLFHQFVHVALFCDMLRLFLLNFLTATRTRYFRLFRLGTRMMADFLSTLGLIMGLKEVITPTLLWMLTAIFLGLNLLYYCFHNVIFLACDIRYRVTTFVGNLAFGGRGPELRRGLHV